MNAHRTAESFDVAAQPLVQRYLDVRRMTEHVCAPLSPEDQMVQSCPEASPAKWHRAHTTWFFETFLLEPHAGAYKAFHPDFRFLFNSYYVNVGDRPMRTHRGLWSRPSADEVTAYRAHVDRHMVQLIEGLDVETRHAASLSSLVELGLNHEQQHQELIVTDIQHALWTNPLRPAYRRGTTSQGVEAQPLRWIEFDSGNRTIGHSGDSFCFDNETPAHEVLLQPFRLASRLVTCGEYLEFIEAGGYATPTLWLSDGWDAVVQNRWQAPLYWEQQDGAWRRFSLHGMRDVDPAEPVTHISYYEADAYARWAGARLATEFEWEAAARTTADRVDAGDSPAGSFLEDEALRPLPSRNASRLSQMLGDGWEWTASAYLPYPGYRPLEGALGEYNGKFMCNQMVLRGGSCATPRSHIRASYRNFFPPQTRWQFSGIRLAHDRS